LIGIPGRTTVKCVIFAVRRYNSQSGLYLYLASPLSYRAEAVRIVDSIRENVFAVNGTFS